MSVIEVENLSVRYGEHVAVRSASFSVAAGEVVALLGPNGAGKTTMLEAIQGYRQPDSGSVLVFGLEPITNRRILAERWGVMPQSGGVPMGLTVQEAVNLFADLHGFEPDTDRLIGAVGLGELSKRRWRRLSGGEQQRLSLALALCGGRDLLMLDEPTASVDAQGRQQILDIIAERSTAGAGVLLTTHRFDDVEAVADKVVILNHGTVVASGRLEDLTAGVSEIRFTAPTGLETNQLSKFLGFPVTEVKPGQYVVNAAPDPSTIAAVTTWLAKRGHTLGQLQAGRRNLEDVFNEVTGPEPTEPRGDNEATSAATEGGNKS